MKNLIKSEGFGIVALVIILIPQITHSVYLFEISSQHENPWFSWCYAIGVDLAILIFTVHGWQKTALAFLVATLATNIIYFLPSENLIRGILLSLMQSGTIYAYSHLYVEQSEAKETTAEEAQEPSVSERYEIAKAQGIHFEPQPYVCPTCGDSFSSAKKLNGHISGHKQKGEWDESKYPNWEQENEQRALVLSQLFINGHVQRTDRNERLIP